MDLDLREFAPVHLNCLWGKYQEARERALSLDPEFKVYTDVLDELWASAGFKMETV